MVTRGAADALQRGVPERSRAADRATETAVNPRMLAGPRRSVGNYGLPGTGGSSARNCLLAPLSQRKYASILLGYSDRAVIAPTMPRVKTTAPAIATAA